MRDNNYKHFPSQVVAHSRTVTTYYLNFDSISQTRRISQKPNNYKTKKIKTNT